MNTVAPICQVVQRNTMEGGASLKAANAEILKSGLKACRV